jgi:hypothetical protein
LHSWQASVIFGRTSVAATVECLSHRQGDGQSVAEAGLEPATQRL